MQLDSCLQWSKQRDRQANKYSSAFIKFTHYGIMASHSTVQWHLIRIDSIDSENLLHADDICTQKLPFNKFFGGFDMGGNTLLVLL